MKRNDLFTEKNYRILQLADEISNVMHEWKSQLNNIYTLSSGTLLNSEFGLVNETMYNENLILINENIKSIINTINSFDTFLQGRKECKYTNINNTLQSAISSHTSIYEKYNINIETNYVINNYISSYESELPQIFHIY